MDDRRRNLWTALLDADMNERYWDCMARRLGKIDKGAKICVAVVSTGAAASLILTAGEPWMWKLLSAVAAAGNVSMTILDNRTQIEKMAAMKQTWAEFRVEYELLWAKREVLSEPEFARFGELRKEETERTVEEAKLPKSNKLLCRAQADVLRSRGLGEKSKETTNV